MSAPRLVEHFFRHDYGRLVAILTRRVGVRHLERVEDAVQSALMAALTARLGSRVDATGGLLLLEEQDRSLWDRERIRLGSAWLARSARGDVFSRFHAEAGIAAEHCFAP